MNQKQGYKILVHAYPPMALGLCGNHKDVERVRKCIESGNCEDIEEVLKDFKTLGSYVRFFRQILGVNRLDDISEAYWIGSDVLKKVGNNNFSDLVDILENNGTPKALIWHLRKKAPRFFKPHHAFQVLMAAKRSGDTEDGDYTKVNTCIISRGIIKRISKGEITVERDIVVPKGNQLKISQKIVAVKMDKVLPKGLKVGDVVSMHWGWICQKLTKKQERNLTYWTKKSLENHGII